jgi:hypothetical protein
LKDYPSWIAENEIAVLLIDEKLGGKSIGIGDHVNYEGHDLVKSLRQRNKTLPLYFLTGFKDNAAVAQRFADVEEIIDKDDFKKNRSRWIDRFTRKGNEYFESVKDQLAQLNELSLKIAKGEATQKDKRKAKAIQTSLEIPLTTESVSDRSEWAQQYEEKLKEFDELRKEIASYLKQKSRKKKR